MYSGCIDIGGTFTDLVLHDRERGLEIFKSPTTPGEFEKGFINVLGVAADSRGLSLRDFLGRMDLLVHGTTVSTNALVEGKVAAVSDGCVEIDGNDGYKFKTRSSEPVTVGQQVCLALRPEKIRIAHEQPVNPINAIPGKVEDIGYLGSISHYHVRTAPGERVTALRANAAHAVERTINWDENVWLDWPVDAGVVLTR